VQAIDVVDSLGAGELTPDDTDVQANLAVAASVAALNAAARARVRGCITSTQQS
jgi:hypothetical protein